MEPYMWYDATRQVTVTCHISYYQRRPVCHRLFLDGIELPDFTGYISWLGLSDFILEPHAPSVARIRARLGQPDTWDGRFRIPRFIGDIWASGLEPVS